MKPTLSLLDREEIEQILAALNHVSTVSRDCVLLHYLQQEEYGKNKLKGGEWSETQVRVLRNGYDCQLNSMP